VLIQAIEEVVGELETTHEDVAKGALILKYQSQSLDQAPSEYRSPADPLPLLC
jgi:hypothetical protein